MPTMARIISHRIPDWNLKEKEFCETLRSSAALGRPNNFRLHWTEHSEFRPLIHLLLLRHSEVTTALSLRGTRDLKEKVPRILLTRFRDLRKSNSRLHH